MLRRVWWASTKDYNDFQPFCLAELRNKPKIGAYSDPELNVKIKGDAVIGCDSGALLFYEMNAVVNNVAVMSGVAVGSTKEITREKITFNSFMRLPSSEPITHIYELEGSN